MKKNIAMLVISLFLISCETITTKNKEEKANQIKPYTGEIIIYYRNGKIKSKEIYKDGELNGEILKYYEDGDLESKRIYKNGKLIESIEY